MEELELVRADRASRTAVLREPAGVLARCRVAPDRRSGVVERPGQVDLRVERERDGARFQFRTGTGQQVAVATKTALVRERFDVEVGAAAIEVVRVRGPLRRRWEVRAMEGATVGEAVQRPLARWVHDLSVASLPPDGALVLAWLLTAMQFEDVHRRQRSDRHPGLGR